MSKLVYIKILLLAVLALAVSCKKEAGVPAPVPEVQKVHYKAAVQTGVETRATIGEDLKYVYEVGDRVYVESEDGNLYGFLSMVVEDGIGSNLALFEGDLNYVGETPFEGAGLNVNLILVSENDLHTITAEGKVSSISYAQNKWSDTLEDAVSHMSHFTGSGHFDDLSFTLHQQSSFLKCFVRLKAEQAPVERVISAKLFNNNDVLLREASITVSQTGAVPFVFAFPGNEVSLDNAKLVMAWGDDASDNVSFDVASQTLASNTYYNISRSTLLFDGFKIKAINNGTRITFNYNYEDDGIEYSLDFGESWNPYTTPFTLQAGDVACIKGNRTNYKNAGTDEWETPSNKPIFEASKKCYISGNIMSLLADEEQLSVSAFQGAFSKGSGTKVTYIDIDPEAPLELPVTTLASKCYMQMFRNCTSLTRAPTFRVEGTAYRCCYNMFRQCSGLADVSTIELPATTLSQDCYRELFRQCSQLKTCPVLPAPTLVKECYRQMFSKSGITTIVCLATNISAELCLDQWMSEVAGGGTFYKSPSMSGWPSGQSGIPSNWTVVDYSE